MAACSLCLAGGVLIGALAGSQSAAGKSSPPTAHAAVACSGYGKAPLLNYPILSAVGRFSCSTGAPSATATLVLQGFKHRKWTKIDVGAGGKLTPLRRLRFDPLGDGGRRCPGSG
jgi:hypothetical protein